MRIPDFFPERFQKLLPEMLGSEGIRSRILFVLSHFNGRNLVVEIPQMGRVAGNSPACTTKALMLVNDYSDSAKDLNG